MEQEHKAIWLVWTGVYSDKNVVAVFDNEESADEALKQLSAALSDYEEPRIEKMLIGEMHPRLHGYECCMRPDGEIAYEDDELYHAHFAADGHAHWSDSEQKVYSFTAYGTSKEEARKNCADFRRAWLAAHPEVNA